jgi:pimeloyl-ACP methyl ester carboxylesterase
MQVHYREEGKGTPLVLIHGTGASLHTWQGWVDKLKQHYRIIRFDLPAFGLTGPHPQHDYKISTYVKFVHELLQKKGIEKCHIAGNSLGGNIAWRFALAYPDKVDKMILLDPSGVPLLKKRKKIWVMQLARAPIINQVMRYATPRAIFKKNLLAVYHDDTKVSPELVTRYQELMLRAGNRDAFIHRAKTPFEDRSAALKNIQTNTLIMWGKDDQWIPVELAYVFKEKLPNNQLIVYPKVGHVPMEEIPTKTAKDALRFLVKRKK